MKRYLLFAGDNYYPDGGWNDFQGSFDSKKEAQNKCNISLRHFDWWQIVDTKTEEIENLTRTE